MSNFIAYYRVSTQRQGDSGLGLEAQRANVERYVASIGGRIVGDFTEIESGKRVTRPQLDAAIRSAADLGATLIVAKLDRLARNTRYILKILDSKIPVTFCDLPQVPDGALGRFMLTQIAAVAEFERGMISERTKAALVRAKLRGVKLGTNGRALARRNRGVADAYARNVMAKVMTVYPDMKPHEFVEVSQDQMRALLAGAEIKTVMGKPWGKTTTQRLMHRIKRLAAAES